MSLTFQEHFDFIATDISEFKVKFDANKQRLLFPLSITSGVIPDGEGLSLGYPFDTGVYTTVTYEMGVGALADDTVVMLRVHREQEKTSAKELYLDDYVTGKDIIGTPAYQAFLANFPLKKCEICERMDGENADTTCQNYHHWDYDRQRAYDKLYKVMSDDIKSATLIVDLPKQRGVERLLQAKNGDYIAHISRYALGDMDEYFYCNLTIDLDELLQIVAVKHAIVKQHQELGKNINANLKQLQTIFGYQAE